jgi:hypothetical protein
MSEPWPTDFEISRLGRSQLIELVKRARNMDPVIQKLLDYLRGAAICPVCAGVDGHLEGSRCGALERAFKSNAWRPS